MPVTGAGRLRGRIPVGATRQVVEESEAFGLRLRLVTGLPTIKKMREADLFGRSGRPGGREAGLGRYVVAGVAESITAAPLTEGGEPVDGAAVILLEPRSTRRLPYPQLAEPRTCTRRRPMGVLPM